ncbi:MAG TPA: hypothetical protein VE079_15780 [Ensifer sp.]|nr:hypothetical protein [Ensifer sp.]
MTDLETAARKFCDAVEFDMNGRDGRGGNGGLMSDTTLRACHEVQAILNAQETQDLEQRHITQGMAMAAAIVERAFDNSTVALEILNAAGLTTLQKLQEAGVEEVDVEALKKVIDRDLERDHCVACSKMLEPGDLVYVEHGEGGYICADCTGDDPESFVGEDGEPLRPGEPIPTPFAYGR